MKFDQFGCHFDNFTNYTITKFIGFNIQDRRGQTITQIRTRTLLFVEKEKIPKV